MKKEKFKFYRADLLRDAKEKKGVSLRDIYAETGIAINTQQKGFAGRNLPEQTLRTLADYLGVGWLDLHDIEFVLDKQSRMNDGLVLSPRDLIT